MRVCFVDALFNVVIHNRLHRSSAILPSLVNLVIYKA